MAKGDRWSDDRDVKVREMRNAETVLGVIRECEFKVETTGELLEIERLTSSSGGGRMEKDAAGYPQGPTNPGTSRTSPAAYPTSCPVWRGAAETGPQGNRVTAHPIHRHRWSYPAAIPLAWQTSSCWFAARYTLQSCSCNVGKTRCSASWFRGPYGYRGWDCSDHALA